MKRMTQKDRLAQFCRHVFFMWNHIGDEQKRCPRGQWHRLGEKQAYRDALEDAKKAGLIEEYKFPWSVKIKGEWIDTEPMV